MRRMVLFTRLVALLAVVSLVGPACATEPRPLAVLSLASHNDVTCDVSSAVEIVACPESPAWLYATLKLFSEGAELSSLDTSRPWGAVVQFDEKLSAFAFIPIKDAEQLSWDLADYVEIVSNDGDVYEIVGKEAGRRLYAKQVEDWVFVSDSADTLRSLPYHPQELLGGLHEKYDVALQLELGNVPEKDRKKLLAMLDQGLGPVVRQLTSAETVENIGAALSTLEHVTFGWSPHRSK